MQVWDEKSGGVGCGMTRLVYASTANTVFDGSWEMGEVQVWDRKSGGVGCGVMRPAYAHMASNANTVFDGSWEMGEV